jgi:hypothetical protein
LVVAFVVGFVTTLGIRAAASGPDGPPAPGLEEPAVKHHEAPGHEGHGHEAGSVPETDPHAGHAMEKDGSLPDEKTDTPTPPTGLLVDLGNAACPIMGGKVDGETFSEWDGLRVGHCCAGCGDEFLTDPVKYLDEQDIEWRPAAEAVKQVREAAGTAKDDALARLEERWKVIRRPESEVER